MRRRDGKERAADMPEPDEVFGRSPVWLPETIDAWRASRPGRGTGGGRPRIEPTEESAADNIARFVEDLRAAGVAAGAVERRSGQDAGTRFAFALDVAGSSVTVQMPGGPVSSMRSGSTRLHINGLPSTWTAALKTLASMQGEQ